MFGGVVGLSPNSYFLSETNTALSINGDDPSFAVYLANENAESESFVEFGEFDAS